ncbi:MAG: polysaccharide deacetylase family protein [Clostridia bacterium]|nr:polysaccharide deacetylase family protein [Clostridia bacterium]
MRKIICLLLLLCLLPVSATAETEDALPEALRVSESIETQTLKGSIYVNTAYPHTANQAVDAEMAVLLDEMREAALPSLPKKAGNTKEGAYLDVQPSVYRTGSSWMSFLSTAIIRDNRKQTYAAVDARAYDIETGKRLSLHDVLRDEDGWRIVGDAVRSQLSAYFPDEQADAVQLQSLSEPAALEFTGFTLNTAYLQLHYRADKLYAGKTTLMHVRVPYTDLAGHLTAEAEAQTDNSMRKLIALTYDDGPVVGRTMRVVRNLRAGGANATFFIVGERIHYCPNEVTLAHDAGFAIASHNWLHVYKSANRGKVIQYRDKLNAELYKYIGIGVSMMRAPGGHEQIFIDEDVHLPLIHWSTISKSKDNKVTDPAAEARRLAKGAKDGDIILLHDIYTGTDKMAETLPGLLADAGFLCVTVDEMFAAKGIPLNPNEVYWDTRGNDSKHD